MPRWLACLLLGHDMAVHRFGEGLAVIACRCCGRRA
jgi:hypothetical protein